MFYFYTFLEYIINQGNLWDNESSSSEEGVTPGVSKTIQILWG
jgi:hypothetical protein